jgi:hypothetical protein
MTDDLPVRSEANWKTQTYALGGIAGVIMGLLAAYFYARASEENGSGPSRIKTMDALKLAVSLLGVVRQITDLGADMGKK